MLSQLWLVVFLGFAHTALCGDVNQKNRELLDRMLAPERYDPRLRPSNVDDRPTTVAVNTFVRSITAVDDVKMQYNVQLTFRQSWTDERLKYNESSIKYLTLLDTKAIWVPDLFFSNEKKGHFHDMLQPNVYVRVFHDGQVLTSQRVSLTLSCPMNFKAYPFDAQVCTMRMASYGFTTEDVILVWKNSDPVQVVRNLHLPNFALENFATDSCDSRTNTGTYSCIKVDFFFKREALYHLLHVYIPSLMMVLVSWTSFWVDPVEVTGRILLSVLTLMVTALQVSFTSASQPQTSYIKSINVWTGVCLTFIFATLLEFCTVHYISTTGSTHTKMCDETEHNDDAALMKQRGNKNEEKCTLKQHFKKLGCFQSLAKKLKNKVKYMDIASRIVFPALFLLFNLIYWSCTLS